MAEIAGCQLGAIAHRQLIALGFSRRTIERLVAKGHLHRVHRGVYLVGHTARAPNAAEMAALLAVGDGAVLSHGTAAAQFGILEQQPPMPELTVAGRELAGRPGVRIHRTASFGPAEVVRRGPLRLTSPARTLLDIAPRLDERSLRWAINEAQVRKLVSPTGLNEALARHSGRRGVARMRGAVEELTGEAKLTRTEIERRLHDIVRATGLPHPQANVKLLGWSVDLYWPEQRVIVEADSFAYHSGRTAFERDRSKDASLQAAGFKVARLSWRQITREPVAVAALLGRLAAGG